MEQISTLVVYYRGDTSKASIVDARQFPVDEERDVAAWVMAMYGSPDMRQLDGIGGADPLTSKFAIVGPPTRDDADIDYTFFQVSVEHPMVSKDMNCGTLRLSEPMQSSKDPLGPTATRRPCGFTRPGRVRIGHPPGLLEVDGVIGHQVKGSRSAALRWFGRRAA